MKQSNTLRQTPVTVPCGTISRKQLVFHFMNGSTLKAACLLVALIVSAQFTKAQYHPAVLTDNPYSYVLWPNSGTHPNASAIDYSLESSTPWGGAYVLKATAADYTLSSSFSGMVYVDDNEGLGWYGFQVDPNPGFTVNPDVAFCDNVVYYPGMFPNSYFIPIVYTEGGTVYLQIAFFFIPGNGSGGGSGYFTYPTGPIRVSDPGVATSPARIDAESKYSTPNAWGSPTTDNVTITWAEGGAGLIRACAVSMNSIIATMPTLPTTLLGFPSAQYQAVALGPNVTSPDVAMVERKNTMGGFDDWALFTYLDNSVPQRLMYVEWDVSASMLYPPFIVDMNGNEAPPRIDAVDDYHYNNPAGPNAYYTIVTSGFTPAHPIPTVIEYNNLTPPIGFDVFAAAGLLGMEKPYQAVVTCGSNNCAGGITAGNYGYTVQYNCTGLYNTDLAQQIDWNTGIVMTPDFYEVPMNPITGPYNAIASPNNENGSIAAPQYLFSAWDDGTSNLWSKLNSPCPFSFKQDVVTKKNKAESYSVKKVANGVMRIMPSEAVPGAWAVSPNPASTSIVLSAGTMDKDKQYNYGLTDVTGRVITSAPVTNAQQTIDVSTLAPGIYLLTVYENGEQTQTMKVVKQ